MRNWEANWEEKRCGIERCKVAELGGEMGGRTMQKWAHSSSDFDLAIEGCNGLESGGELVVEMVQYWQVNWILQRCNIVQ
jgi:hypothetical protein